MSVYGCHNRKPFAPFHSYWKTIFWGSKVLGALVHVDNRGAPDCQYTKTALGQQDPKCAECKWKATTLKESA